MVTDSSDDDGALGQQRGERGGERFRRERAGGQRGRGRGCWHRPAPCSRPRPPRRSASSAPIASSVEPRELVHLAAVRRQHARLARIGEERHRRLGADQDEVRTSFSTASAWSTGYGRRSTARGRRRARCARWSLGDERAPVCAAMRPASSSALPRSASAAEQSIAGSPERSAPRRSARSRPSATGAGAATGGTGGDAVGLVPRGVGGQDQRGDLARARCAPPRSRPRRRRRPRGRRRGAHPGGHRARDALDVGGERRIVLEVIGRVLADDVDDARAGLAARCAGWRARCRGPGPRCSRVAAGLSAMR